MNKNIPEQSNVDILFEEIIGGDMRISVKNYNDLNKYHFVAIAEAHHAKPIFGKDGFSYEINISLPSVRFFIRDLEIFEARWPKLIQITLQRPTNLHDFIEKLLEKNKKTFPD